MNNSFKSFFPAVLVAGFVFAAVASLLAATTPDGLSRGKAPALLNISGTYPHLAVFSDEGEIGIGAVASWAGRLWFITYPPHLPQGSGDKLWEVDSNLVLAARSESVGGTHANRMIHRETQQLIVGPYVIGSNGTVRVISPGRMPGRLTANARHLTDPAHRLYFLTMEKGLYDVDVNTLDVQTIYADGNVKSSGDRPAPLSGAHGKGGYTGQGRLLYAANGEAGWNFSRDPELNGPAGVLAEHTGAAWPKPWKTVERNPFTEVTGPGGLYGNRSPSDPVWALGWDKRSVILELLDGGSWHTYRLPKASYTHDALHGWYTEWPRIREIAHDRFLMHMHGMFYFFPKTFAAVRTGGIQPLCTYLKMPVDYCWWNDQLVMGRDDSSTTGGNKWAGQSNSALWFGQLSDLETWGAPAGFGGVWKRDEVSTGTPSDPFLVAGFKHRVLHLQHKASSPLSFAVQYDAGGWGSWQTLTNLDLPAGGYSWLSLPPELEATWLRLVPGTNASGVTAWFMLGNSPRRPVPALFAGLADALHPEAGSGGIIRAKTGDARTLQFAADLFNGIDKSPRAAYYEIDGALQLRRVTNSAAESALRRDYGLRQADFAVDAASVICREGRHRFRLPKSAAAYDRPFVSGWPRGVREVVTERNLLNAHGTFYELPRPDAGGMRRIRPVATHNKRVTDFASWRGLFVMAGVSAAAAADGHVFRSDDGQAALWLGNVDDLWQMGAPAGVGGPWHESAVAANIPSDPYLMYGYERKVLELSHSSRQPVTFTIEVDVAADDNWSEFVRFAVPAGQTFRYVFPEGYSAHWVRFRADTDTTATATLTYGPSAGTVSQ